MHNKIGMTYGELIDNNTYIIDKNSDREFLLISVIIFMLIIKTDKTLISPHYHEI
ncbi:hypothetical protein [Clostridium sp. FP1]|uniref:hypothetical protein n=1 Tax=Clostridium sp. FP1 TaxID=2724076 RepID=UPI001CCD5131|nr:hypothetical protein [Clostridium sp. FP1]MBZ9634321.1 hypothetical protein [Clostridium sp. FP1]